jgi:hypothetical protein
VARNARQPIAVSIPAPEMKVAQALLPVPKADAFHAEHTGKSACATLQKPEQATDRTW